MKEILVIIGSSITGGNTDLLAQAFLKGARAAGHHVTSVLLGKKNIHGCLGCNACRHGNPCIQQDDMQELYAYLEQADMVVLASPLYFWTISAGIKAFIERLYAISMNDEHPPLGRYERYPHKTCALLMSAADHNFWTFEQAVSYYNFTIVHYLGWTSKGMILAGGCGGVDTPRSIRNTTFLEEAYQFGTSI